MDLGYAVVDTLSGKYHEGGDGFSKKITRAMFHKTLEEARDSRDYALDIYEDEVELKIVKVNLDLMYIE